MSSLRKRVGVAIAGGTAAALALTAVPTHSVAAVAGAPAPTDRLIRHLGTLEVLELDSAGKVRFGPHNSADNDQRWRILYSSTNPGAFRLQNVQNDKCLAIWPLMVDLLVEPCNADRRQEWRTRIEPSQDSAYRGYINASYTDTAIGKYNHLAQRSQWTGATNQLFGQWAPF